jgi:plasmid stabilization system protein ParE
MTYSLHPGAEQDVARAMDFYRDCAGPVVAARFLEEFEHVVKLLVDQHRRPGYAGGRR